MNDHLRGQYYRRFYPFRTFFEWLNHGEQPSRDIMHRELGIVLEGETFLRYQSFASVEALRAEILRLNPIRFEVGPVYTANPRDRKIFPKQAFRPIEKELVFDIDLTDYDPVRTCCSKTEICGKCWRYINYAIDILGTSLREDFGFEHILWVYSGRRGAHAWVCDARARDLTDQERRAITNYLSIDPQTKIAATGFMRPLHPHLLRSLNMLKACFEKDVLIDQNPWGTEEQAETLLKLLRNDSLANSLRTSWGAKQLSSLERWRSIDDTAKKLGKSFNPARLLEAKQDIVLKYMYPRIDVNVSTRLNHLLKAPFCIHPGTGRICVPIDSKIPGKFNPLTVPTVDSLIEGLDDENNGEKDALKPYTALFESFVKELNVSVKRPVPDSELDF